MRDVLTAVDHGPSVKDDEQYEALRDQGASKEKAARIANTDREAAAKRGGQSQNYDDWTEAQLQDRAKELDVDGRSEMNKDDLIAALRNH